MTQKGNRYLRHYIGSILVCSVLAFAEPSVYGFGSDEDTSDSTSHSGTENVVSLKQQIAEQNERIDGLTTVIEGLSATVNELRQSRGVETSSMGGESDDASNRALLEKLASMIDEINANYVSKEELNNALGTTSKAKVPAKTVEKKQESTEGKSNAQLYSEAVRMFGKKRYDEAQKRFVMTDAQGYKPAASNYYLGEIAYYTKKYEDAIFYFKKSAGIYDKASYIDTLLLHTAVSLEKSGDRGQAKAFYENIIENYPTKNSAKIAKDRLKKL